MHSRNTLASLILVPVLGAILGLSTVAVGQGRGREPLKIGDPAPDLSVDAWVAGG